MRSVLFFIGTEAELIKLFPVILECKERELDFHIIASGQNDITDSVILKKATCGNVELELSCEKKIKKTAAGLFSWWLKTYTSGAKQIMYAFPNIDFKDSFMVVHGDTVSTYMGAKLGRKLGMTVCHVEAGLRSHNIFSPFPEEIDRLLTSRLARIHFAPGDYAYDNLNRVKGKVINTHQNTLIDSLRFSRDIPIENEAVKQLMGKDFFVFVMHRQENLANKSFVIDVVKEIENAAQSRMCVVLLHKITENAFEKFELLEELKSMPNIVLLPRVGYFDFMKLLNNASFVITDGGSNQEELFYMRKPCLILRTVTERKEGLGINARLFNGDATDIGIFIDGVSKQDITTTIHDGLSPSKLIVDYLE